MEAQHPLEDIEIRTLNCNPRHKPPESARGFAERTETELESWSGWRESNPRIQLGRLLLYH